MQRAEEIGVSNASDGGGNNSDINYSSGCQVYLSVARARAKKFDIARIEPFPASRTAYLLVNRSAGGLSPMLCLNECRDEEQCC